MDEQPKSTEPTNETDQLLTLIRAANNGDAAAEAELRGRLSGPHADKLVKTCGDLAQQAEECLLSTRLGNQKGSKILIQKHLGQMRHDLGWEKAPKLERILIERVVQTWLMLHFLELELQQNKSDTLAQAKFKEDQLTQANRRHMSAVKMLAVVRKMALPLEVSIKAEVTVNNSKPKTADIMSKLGNRLDMLGALSN